LPDVGNGADVITGPLLRLLNYSKLNFLLFNLGLLAGFGGLLVWLRRKQQFDVRRFPPVIAESALYALSMGSIILCVTSVIGIDPKLVVDAASAKEPGRLSRVALSLGAGVHEELIFRLAMIPALTWVLEQVGGLRRWLALAGGFVVSSLLFSAAHHVI